MLMKWIIVCNEKLVMELEIYYYISIYFRRKKILNEYLNFVL